jgi:hypothetical protein
MRNVGSFGPGRHAVRLSEREHPRPSVYLLHPSQGRDAARGKVVVMN